MSLSSPYQTSVGGLVASVVIVGLVAISCIDGDRSSHRSHQRQRINVLSPHESAHRRGDRDPGTPHS
jgi:hypothetical protein